MLFPCGARDYTCGYRVYRVSLLRWGQARYGRHFLNQQGFSVMVDLLLKLRRRARRIDEVPLILRYDRKRGASKMKVARTIGTTLRLLGRRFVGESDRALAAGARPRARTPPISGRAPPSWTDTRGAWPSRSPTTSRAATSGPNSRTRSRRSG